MLPVLTDPRVSLSPWDVKPSENWLRGGLKLSGRFCFPLSLKAEDMTQPAHSEDYRMCQIIYWLFMYLATRNLLSTCPPNPTRFHATATNVGED